MGLNLGGSSTGTSRTETTAPAQWLEDATQRGSQYAENMFNSPYQSYGGPRVAGLSANEQQAANLAGQDRYSPYLQKAEGAYGRAGQIGSTSAAGGIKQYMDPYREGVLDIAGRKMGREYDTSLNRLRGQAASRGAFGGSRQTMLESNLKRDFLESQGDLYQKGLSDAYGQALGASQADLNRNLQGAIAEAGGYSQLGGQAAGMTNDQIRALMATGETGRGIEQAGLDAQFEEYLRAQGMQREDLDRFLASLRAGDYSRSGTSTTSGGGQSGSLGLNLGSLFGGFG